jgi:hypothetical protein
VKYRAWEDLTEQSKEDILQSESIQFEIDNQKLQQNVKKIKELYEENGLKLQEINGRGSLLVIYSEENFQSRRKDQPCN